MHTATQTPHTLTRGDRICLRPETPKCYRLYLEQDGWDGKRRTIITATFERNGDNEPMVVIYLNGWPIEFPAKYAMEHPMHDDIIE